MDRIFRHLGPVLVQVNKTLYTVLPILARAAPEFWRSFTSTWRNLRRTKLEKFTLEILQHDYLYDLYGYTYT